MRRNSRCHRVPWRPHSTTPVREPSPLFIDRAATAPWGRLHPVVSRQLAMGRVRHLGGNGTSVGARNRFANLQWGDDRQHDSPQAQWVRQELAMVGLLRRDWPGRVDSFGEGWLDRSLALPFETASGRRPALLKHFRPRVRTHPLGPGSRTARATSSCSGEWMQRQPDRPIVSTAPDLRPRRSTPRIDKSSRGRR